ncbi:MAG: glucose 1-dehydrogenase [Acidimicrobiales bacterium]
MTDPTDSASKSGAEARSRFSLDGRTALITGSSRGIGLAIANALGSAGAAVVLNGRTSGPLEAVVEQLRDVGIVAHCRVADVTDVHSVESMVDSIEADIGPLDVLVNNAGAQHRAPFLEFPLDEFTHLLELNLVAPFVVAQAVARQMVKRGSGKIINICSVMSELARPGITPYTATKGGLKLLTRGLCADLGPLGIQVNAIAPGYFATELNEALLADAEFTAWVARRTPAGRWGDVEELGGAAVFFASEASSYVNGQILYVDGGMTAVV